MLVSALVLALGAGTLRAQTPTPDPAPVPAPVAPPPSSSPEPTSSATEDTGTDASHEKKAEARPPKRRERQPASPSSLSIHPPFAITAPGAGAGASLGTLVASERDANVARVREGRTMLLAAFAALAILLGVGALLPRSVFHVLAARTRSGFSHLGP